MTLTGKLGVAPYGCLGVHVTANYVTCLSGCDRDTPADGVPAIAASAKCPRCHSSDIAHFGGFSFSTGKAAMHCWSCSAVWPSDVDA